MTRLLSRKSGLAAQPTSSTPVLLTSTDGVFSPEAIQMTAQLAQRTTVAVLVITRIHGYAMGIPNPGLLPTRKEQEAAKESVAQAISALRRHGVVADGQVAASRSAAKAIARVARVRAARHIVLDCAAEGGRLRRLVEGDPTAGLRRRLDPAVDLHIVSSRRDG